MNFSNNSSINNANFQNSLNNFNFLNNKEIQNFSPNVKTGAKLKGFVHSSRIRSKRSLSKNSIKSIQAEQETSLSQNSNNKTHHHKNNFLKTLALRNAMRDVIEKIDKQDEDCKDKNFKAGNKAIKNNGNKIPVYESEEDVKICAPNGSYALADDCGVFRRFFNRLFSSDICSDDIKIKETKNELQCAKKAVELGIAENNPFKTAKDVLCANKQDKYYDIEEENDKCKRVNLYKVECKSGKVYFQKKPNLNDVKVFKQTQEEKHLSEVENGNEYQGIK